MNKTKRMNTYLKFTLIILLCMAIGAAAGSLSVFAEDPANSLAAGVSAILSAIAAHFQWILLIILAAAILNGEISLAKIKNLGNRMKTADDDVCDALDYAMEKTSAFANGIHTTLMALSFLLLTLVCSADNSAAVSSETGILWGVIVFLLFVIYCGFWSVRFIKLQQKIDPDKQGDPASRRFTEQWVESCDEAEKELIYQSSYKCFLLLSKSLPLLIAAAMLMHLCWDTGITAVFFICLIWLMLNFTYLRSCVKGKRQKLRL